LKIKINNKKDNMSSILDYLQIKPSAQSVDYVENKQQFISTHF